MFGINRKTEADSKTERVKELEKINAKYKKRIAKQEIMIKRLDDKMVVHIKNLKELEQRAKETKEEHDMIKRQHVAENKLLLRHCNKLESQARDLERRIDREFVKKEKPSPSLMWRLRTIKDKILDFIR